MLDNAKKTGNQTLVSPTGEEWTYVAPQNSKFWNVTKIH
jgi:hypothetical protein